ncbi:hypothetical protein NLI96_g301 [Meripilus lineatus]|uniref:F-box domain-containing protein n=1 Tax=Meripilus lineatus TaxID=2056292 RepID=A0AAD5VGR1_9APHY|nr:hypothetical protein NLI96_g301 [Physisporinus lineatus]
MAEDNDHQPLSKRHSIAQPFSSLRKKIRASLSHRSSSNPIIEDVELIAPSLPPELLLLIIDYLALPYHLAAFAAGCLLSRVDRESFTHSMLFEARSNLLHTTRVCRSWNAVATEILYSKIFLLSPTQLLLFCRSLKRNPTLCSFVKQLYVLQPQHKSTRLLQRVPWAITPGVGDIEFPTLLAACTSLETLTFTYCPKRPSVYSSWTSGFMERSGIGAHLKELAIHGTTGEEHKPLEMLNPAISLPLLEVLVLKAVTLNHNHQFPVFPKLRTLRIVLIPRVKVPGVVFQLNIYATNFPSLRRLVLQDTNASIHVDEAVLRNLWSLRMCGTSERTMYNAWVMKGYLENVTLLEFHLKKLKPGRFMVTRYPPALKSLVLCITFSKRRDSEVIKADVLKDFQMSDASDEGYLGV